MTFTGEVDHFSSFNTLQKVLRSHWIMCNEIALIGLRLPLCSPRYHFQNLYQRLREEAWTRFLASCHEPVEPYFFTDSLSLIVFLTTWARFKWMASSTQSTKSSDMCGTRFPGAARQCRDWSSHHTASRESCSWRTQACQVKLFDEYVRVSILYAKWTGFEGCGWRSVNMVG